MPILSSRPPAQYPLVIVWMKFSAPIGSSTRTVVVRLPAPQRSTAKRAEVRYGTSLWRRSSTSILPTVRPSSTHLVIWSSWASSPPRLSVSVGPVRAKPFHHLADQLVGELLLAT